MIQRRRSEESLATLLSSGEDADSRSLYSEETLTDSTIPIFHEKLASYTRIRELPLVACNLKSELLLYASSVAVENDTPLFSIQLNKFHFLKKNAPILTTYRHENGHKKEFCKIYFKILQNNLTCYVFMFAAGRNLVLYNNALKPHCDALYKDTKVRIFGASSSTFGNGSFRVSLLTNSASSLADGLDTALETAASIKDMCLRPAGSTLYDAVVSQKKLAVLRLLAEAAPLVPVPFATYIDQGGAKIDGGRLQGYIRIFEAPNGVNDDFSDDSLVISTVLLALVEQEAVKMRGSNKPSYV